MKKLIAALILTIACFIPFTNKALAAAPAQQTPSGITLSPAIAQVSIQTTDTQARLEFKITNNKSTAQTINITSADFNTLDESGGLVFVGTNPTQIQKKYGLATWLTIPQATVTIPPKQTATVTAFIFNQPSMAAGGHYGALLLQLASSQPGPGKNKVALQPIASSLLFVNKVGGDTHKLKLTDVYVNHSIFTLPGSVTLRFHNDGNTHLIPRGVVTITEPSGKLVRKGIINENSGIILPETNRRYSVPLNKVATALRPGNYKLTVNFRFDGYDQFRSYQTKIFVFAPITFVVMILGLLIILFGIYFLPRNHKIRKYFIKLKKSSKKHLKNN